MTTPTYLGWNNRRAVVRHLDTDRPIWMISDLHIGDATPCDAFFGKDNHLIALLRRVKKSGGVLIIVGDAIDFHQAWSFTRVLRAHQELFHEMSSLSKEGRLYYVIGNHDYEINLFHEILQFAVCDELHIKDDTLVIHGWQYDPFLKDAIGHGHGHSTTIHHMVERYLNTWLRIPLGEFYTRSNRLMFWLAHKAAVVAGAYERGASVIGVDRPAKEFADFLDYWAYGNMGDSMGIFRPAMEALHSERWNTIVCGHSHLPGIVQQGDFRYINTGTWTFSSAHYVTLIDGVWRCRDWITGKEFSDELYRPLLDGGIYDKNFQQWWRENYMGWGKFREGEERKGRLAGWESYVRDHQYLAAPASMSIQPLLVPESTEESDEGAPVPQER